MLLTSSTQKLTAANTVKTHAGKALLKYSCKTSSLYSKYIKETIQQSVETNDNS
jgi:hypothetical protein